MIDLHAHVLPEIDDGATDMAASIAIAREAEASGITAIAATPHVRDDYPTTPMAMAEGVHAVRAAWAEAGLEVTVLPGAEIAVERLGLLSPAELWAFGLGGSPNHVLVEAPLFGWPLDMSQRLDDVHALGFTVVLAHPERSIAVQNSPRLLAELTRNGILLQVTAGSLVGRFGPAAARAAKALVSEGLAHLLATDTHRAGDRGSSIGAALAGLRDPRLARWLTDEVPSAIVAGSVPPPRPRSARRWLRARGPGRGTGT